MNKWTYLTKVPTGPSCVLTEPSVVFTFRAKIVSTSVIVLTATSCCFPQVKNIIYHAVKDAVGTLKAHEPKLARP